MTDTAGGTEPLDRSSVQAEAAALPVEQSAPPTRDPVEAVKDPDNRAKLLLGIAALTLLNFLLLLIILTNVTGGDGDPVVVDGRSCIIRQEEGKSRLFCAD